jgi:hypothetical protein
MRCRKTQLDAGDELTEGAERYTVERVEQSPNSTAEVVILCPGCWGCEFR